MLSLPGVRYESKMLCAYFFIVVWILPAVVSLAILNIVSDMSFDNGSGLVEFFSTGKTAFMVTIILLLIWSFKESLYSTVSICRLVVLLPFVLDLCLLQPSRNSISNAAIMKITLCDMCMLFIPK